MTFSIVPVTRFIKVFKADLSGILCSSISFHIYRNLPTSNSPKHEIVGRWKAHVSVVWLKGKCQLYRLWPKNFFLKCVSTTWKQKKARKSSPFLDCMFSFLLLVPNHDAHAAFVYQVVWIFLYRHINLYPELLGRFQSKIEVVVFFRVCARV